MIATAERKLGRALAIGIATAILAAVVPSQRAWSSEAVPGATVDELLALVRNFNPDLAAAALEAEEATAKIVPAGALDDPMVNLSRDQGFRQTLFSISQDFPLWGKRELRKDVATANAQAARLRIHELLRAVSGTARERYGRGLANQSDAIRAELDRTRLELQLSMLEQAEQTSKAKINALIAHRADAALAPPMVLRKMPPAASLALGELIARARDSNPMLATSRAEIAAAEGERKLVGKSWYPDVTVSVGGDDLPGQSPRPMVGVGIKIPFQWGVREAQAHGATAKKGAAQLRLDGALIQIESELKAALATLYRASQTEDLIKTTLTPQSEAAYRSALSSYQLGRGDLTPILEAVRQQLDIRLELLRVETDAQTAFAAIERLAGGSL